MPHFFPLRLLPLLSLLLGFNPATAQTFNAVIGSGNPLDGVNLGSNATVTFGDSDADGDLDAFTGRGDGMFNFFLNEGTPAVPELIEIPADPSIPFSNLDVGDNSAPVAVDIDNDGDLDLFIGASDGQILFFRNEGSPELVNFDQITGSGNPFDGVDVGENSVPIFADIDGDGDFDCFIGADDGNIYFFRNSGTSSSPVFVAIVGIENPFDGVNVDARAAVTFADLDKDGDLDAVIGNGAGELLYFANVGDAGNPDFQQLTGGANPLNGFSVSSNAFPAFADIDNDGDMDLFVGEGNGDFSFFENTSPLPVEWLSLEATAYLGQVTLKWTTARELNNLGFEVERATDVTFWQAIGFVTGQGQSNEPTPYAFQDAAPLSGTAYYRLKQIDFDGAYLHSPMVEVKDARLTPLAALRSESGRFELGWRAGLRGAVEADLLNMEGKKIAFQTRVLDGNTLETMNFETHELPSGIYFIVARAKHEIQTFKLRMD